MRPFFRTERLERDIAMAALVACLLVASLTSFIRPQYAILGLLGAFVAAGYLGLRRRVHDDPRIAGSQRFYLASSTGFFALLSLSALTLRSPADPTSRSLFEFACSAMMFGVLAFEASPPVPSLAVEIAILLQSAIATFWVRVAPQLLSPGVIGIDSWFHVGIVREIEQTGFIPANNIYHGLPQFHLLGAIFGAVGGSVDLQFLGLLGPIIGVVGDLFVYLLGKWIFDTRAGLLGAITYGFSAYIVSMDFAFLAFALGGTLLVGVFYFFLRYTHSKTTPKLLAAAILMYALIDTHTIMPLALLVMLVVLWTTERAVRFFYGTALEAGRRISGAIPVLFGVMLFGWWAYVSNSFFDMISLLRWGFDFEPWTPPPSWSSYLATAPISEYLLDLSGYLALMALAFIGSLYLLSRQGKTSTEVGLLTAIWILAALGLTTILPQLTGLLGQRWNIAFQLFSGPLVGVGLVWIIRLQKKRAIGILLVALTVAALAFANISSPTGNQDTNVYSPNTFVRLVFSGTEIESLTTVAALHAPTFYVVYPDYYFFRYYEGVGAVDLSPFLVTRSLTNISNGLIVLRSSSLNSPVYYQQTTIRIKYDPVQVLTSFDKVYDSGSVFVFEPSN